MPIIQPVTQSDRTIPEEILTLQNLHHIDLTGFVVHSGIYFLVLNDTIVYVGQSVNVLARIFSHISENVKEFETAFFIPVLEKDLFTVEGAFIRTLRPIYNTNTGKITKNDTRIVNALMFGNADQFEIGHLKPLTTIWDRIVYQKRRKELGFKSGDILLSFKNQVDKDTPIMRKVAN